MSEVESLKRACIAAKNNRDMYPIVKRNLQKIGYRRKRIQMLSNALTMCDKLEHMMSLTFDMIPLKSTIGAVKTVIESVATNTVLKELDTIAQSIKFPLEI